VKDTTLKLWKDKKNLLRETSIPGASVVNDKIYVIGGNFWASEMNEVQQYDPTTEECVYKTNMPTKRMALSCCSVSGKIYAISGFWTPHPDAMIANEEYDPTTDTWKVKAPVPTGRGALTSCVFNGKIYVIGGQDTAINYLNTVEEYNPATDSWSTKSPMPTKRAYLTSSEFNGRIYVFGGMNFDQSTGQTIYLSTVEEYDPVVDTWQKKAAMQIARMGGNSCVVKGKIIVFGGSGDKGDLNSMEIYDPQTDTWEPKIYYMKAPRSGISSVVFDNKIYVFGGTSFTVSSKLVEEYTHSK
jgi:N-acetylneuraminic acid mutarotase